jgi:hypothetical protein
VEAKGAQLTLQAENPRSVFCSDLYLIATDETLRPFWSFRHGESHNSFQWKSENELGYAKDYGVQVFLVQNGTLGFLEDLIETYEMFFSKKRSMQDTLKFLHDKMNLTFTPKPSGVPTKIYPSASEILSGDCLQLFKFGGIQ